MLKKTALTLLLSLSCLMSNVTKAHSITDSEVLVIRPLSKTSSTFKYEEYEFYLTCDVTKNTKGVITIYFKNGDVYKYADIMVEDVSTPVGRRSVREHRVDYNYKVLRSVDVQTIIESYKNPHLSYKISSNKFFYTLMRATKSEPVVLNVGGDIKHVYFKGTGLHNELQRCATATENYRLNLNYSDEMTETLIDKLRFKDQMLSKYGLNPFNLDIHSLQAFITYLKHDKSNVGSWIHLTNTSMYYVLEKVRGGYLVVHWSEFQTGEVLEDVIYLETEEELDVGTGIPHGYYIYNGIIYGIVDGKGNYREKSPKLIKFDPKTGR